MSRYFDMTPAPLLELRRLGLLGFPNELAFDDLSVSDALREAFGDDSWRSLPEGALMDRLRAAAPPRGICGQRRPRYAAMTARGVMECVMAYGFIDGVDGMEASTNMTTSSPIDTAGRLAWLAEGLLGRGYKEGLDVAAPLLARLNRIAQEDGCSRYFSRTKALTLVPPAGAPRTVDVVVRVIANFDGKHGEVAAAGLLDGLCHAAVCVYAGHARYGLGPDFEPALAIDLRPGAPLPAEPHQLMRIAAREARRRGETMEVILDRWLDAGWIRISRSNLSRVVLGNRNLLSRSLMARLTHWVAARAEGGPASPVVGPTGQLASSHSSIPHRLWVLLCCRSKLLFPFIRRTDGLTASALRILGVDGFPRNLHSFPMLLDAICAGCTWEQIVCALNEPAKGCARAAPGRMVVDGWEEDPFIP